MLEPKAGFEIAFNMFDTDGNQRVDKKEFMVVSFLFVYIFTHRCSVCTKSTIFNAIYQGG